MSRQNSGSPQESSSERSQRRVRVLELLSRSSGKVLLGHTNGDVTTHYSAAKLAELITAVSKIGRSLATPAMTLLRTAA